MTQNAKARDKKKIMFIVWKWEDLDAVNEKTLENGKLEKYLSQVSLDGASFFKEYEVEKSRFCANAQVVASSIYNTPETRPLLYALLEKYAAAGNEVMVFLHRGNFYEEQDVDDLLVHFGSRITNCVLIANGRDFIYYKTQKSGFLDDIGNFAKGWDKEIGEAISICENNEVRQPYFDRVWEYYRIEFETKVFQLKEELFDRWMPFLLPDQPEKIAREHLVDAIKEADERLLWLRLKSFTNIFNEELNEANKIEDEDRIDEIEDEKKELAKLEKAHKVSYFFDDCIKNLNHHRATGQVFVAEAYDEVQSTLKEMLFEKATKTSKIPALSIRRLADQLNYLIKVIPGELD